ncbi:MAG: aromatic amino acid transport family protein [Rickettsiales bacterium]
MTKFISAVSIIAGTAIGAGMLALPLTFAAVGLLWGSVILTLMSILMYFAALLSLELNYNHGGKALSISSLSNIYINKFSSVVANIMLMLLLYALLAAYISGTTSVLTKIYDFGISNQSLALIATLVMGAVIVGQVKWLDRINKVLFLGMLVLWGIIILIMSSTLELHSFLVLDETFHEHSLLKIIPIAFTSFGFHLSMPTVINYCKLDVKRFKLALFIGCFLPLLSYLVWTWSALAVIKSNDIDTFTKIMSRDADLGMMINSLAAASSFPGLAILTKFFSLLAIVTSFFGVGIGLLDFFREKFVKKGKEFSGQIISAIVTFSVPLVIAVAIPNAFVIALSAASIFLSVLAIILPAIALANQRKSKKSKRIMPLDNVGLVIVILGGLLVIAAELFNNLW